MTVLDASAALALIFEEPGQQRVLDAILDGAEMTTANFAGVATRYVLRGASAADLSELRNGLAVMLVPIDEDLVVRAAPMAPGLGGGAAAVGVVAKVIR